MVVKTLNAEQIALQQLSTLRPSEYISYVDEIIVAGSLYVANEYDIGAALKAKYGTSWDVPATTGYLAIDGSLKMRFNDITNDVINWDITVEGRVWLILRSDLKITKIYFKNGDPVNDVTMNAFLTGPKFLGSEPA